ncbi:MAG: bifunctional folylpolyglutamate synthase/dihydrofolate synthase [Lachnospiraceae bacterium]
MLYEEARVYLDNVSKYGSVLGLDSIKGLLKELGDPQKDLTFIHIAGTNGKGSILAYLSTILTEAGYRTGRYISPTVMEYLERFQIDGKYMEKDEFAEITGDVKRAAERLLKRDHLSPTAFEIETAIAFLYFKKKCCDYVVVEAGLGGMLDATNVIENTKLCIFASISMDHIGVLGNTLEEIAEDKAGIIKKGAEVITGAQKKEVLNVLNRKAREKGCSLSQADPEKVTVMQRDIDCQCFSYKEFENIKIHLAGQNQIENAVTAIEAVRVLRRKGTDISDQAVKAGLEKTQWLGRFTVLRKSPLVIVDGAHNEDAARRLAQNVSILLKDKKIISIMGVFKDKEYEKITAIMAPYLQYVYTVDLPNRERTLEKEVLCRTIKKEGVEAEAVNSIEEALRMAKQRAKEDGVVLVFGSLSYLGEVIRLESKVAERNRSW